MSLQNISNSAFAVGSSVVGFCAVVAGSIVSVTIVPVVSLVALPILGIQAAVKGIEYQILRHKAQALLTPGHGQFGRVAGQDFTRWDGKSLNDPMITDESFYKTYPHGCPKPFNTLTVDDLASNPFTTPEDAEWLERECARRKAGHELDRAINTAATIAKLVIPVFGLIWVLRDAALNKWGNMITAEDHFKETWGLVAALKFHHGITISRLEL